MFVCASGDLAKHEAHDTGFCINGACWNNWQRADAPQMLNETLNAFR